MAKVEKKPVRAFYLDESDFPDDLKKAYDKYNEIREGIGKALKSLGAAHEAMERALDPYLEEMDGIELEDSGSWKASFADEDKDPKTPEGFAVGLKVEVFREAYGTRHWRNQKKGKQSLGSKLLRFVTKGGKGKDNRPLQ